MDCIYIWLLYSYKHSKRFPIWEAPKAQSVPEWHLYHLHQHSFPYVHDSSVAVHNLSRVNKAKQQWFSILCPKKHNVFLLLFALILDTGTWIQTRHAAFAAKVHFSHSFNDFFKYMTHYKPFGLVSVLQLVLELLQAVLFLRVHHMIFT